MAPAALSAPWSPTLSRLQSRRARLDRLRRRTHSPAARALLQTLWQHAFRAEQALREKLPQHRAPHLARRQQANHAWACAEALARTPAADAHELQTRRAQLACLVETVRRI